MEKDDGVYVAHILDTIEQIMSRVSGLTRNQFNADETLRLALVHLIQTIGEAASRLSPDFQRQHAHIPWRDIIGMRHRIVHDYLHVDYDIVWEVVSVRIQTLRDQLKPLGPADDAQTPSSESTGHDQEENDTQEDAPS